MGGMIAKYRKPKTSERLAKAIELWLTDAFGRVDYSRRDPWGGKIEVEMGGASAVVIVEGVDRSDGVRWIEADAGQRSHLEAWENAGRPSLDAIRDNGAIGALTQVEAAAVRSIRVGELFEGSSFTPAEIAKFRRNAFLTALERRVDDMLGEPQDPPASVAELAEDFRMFLLMAYDVEAGGEGGAVEVAIKGRRFTGTFEAEPAPKPKPKRRRKAVKP